MIMCRFMKNLLGSSVNKGKFKTWTHVKYKKEKL